MSGLAEALAKRIADDWLVASDGMCMDQAMLPLAEAFVELVEAALPAEAFIGNRECQCQVRNGQTMVECVRCKRLNALSDALTRARALLDKP
jgi:hypothetical protein